MSEFHIVREYAHSVEKLWYALTDPELVPLWTSTGGGGRPEGFVPVVGNHFRLVGRPVPGWDGIVDCEVLEVEPPIMLRHTWQGDERQPSIVTWRIEPTESGSRRTYDHRIQRRRWRGHVEVRARPKAAPAAQSRPARC